jgi:hypothetical protein
MSAEANRPIGFDLELPLAGYGWEQRQAPARM